MNLLEQLQNAGIPYTENESMSRRTTFGIGGSAIAALPALSSSWMATLPPSPGRAIPCAAGPGPLSSLPAGPLQKTAFPAWNGALASPVLWAGEYT